MIVTTTFLLIHRNPSDDLHAYTLGSSLSKSLQRNREKAMADSPLLVPSGAAVPTSPTPSESRAASPDGVETDPAQQCRDRDITANSMVRRCANRRSCRWPRHPSTGPAASTAGEREDNLPLCGYMRGQQVQATSSLHSGAASARGAVSTRSLAMSNVRFVTSSVCIGRLTWRLVSFVEHEITF